MPYTILEASSAEGRPYFLYQFADGAQIWRFTSRAADLVSLSSDGSEITWSAASLAHSNVVQTSEIERGGLEVTWPISHDFARRFLAAMGNAAVTLTIFRGHEQLAGETVAHWKGRIVGAEVEGNRVIFQAESVFSTLRRAGVRAKYQRLCRHALYGRGCNVDIDQHWQVGTLSAVSGAVLTIAQAAQQAAGWYAGGVLRFGGQMGFITNHAGNKVTLSRPMPELAAKLVSPDRDPVTNAVLPVLVDLAPGCDLRVSTCQSKFGNLNNFGGFPDIPGRNPFSGGSVV